MDDIKISMAAKVFTGRYVRDNYPGRLPYCHSMKIVKNGVKRTGRQNLLCRGCGKQFQCAYQEAGCRPEAKQLVLRMLVRNSGIRDIEEVTGVHRQTVLRWMRCGPLSGNARRAKGGSSTPMRRRQTRCAGLELGKPQPPHGQQPLPAAAVKNFYRNCIKGREIHHSPCRQNALYKLCMLMGLLFLQK